jgi:hypothetical protein
VEEHVRELSAPDLVIDLAPQLVAAPAPADRDSGDSRDNSSAPHLVSGRHISAAG